MCCCVPAPKDELCPAEDGGDEGAVLVEKAEVAVDEPEAVAVEVPKAVPDVAGRASVLGNVGASFLGKSGSREGKRGAAGRTWFSVFAASAFAGSERSKGFCVKGEGFVMKHIPLHRVSALLPVRRLAVFPGFLESSYP